MRWSFDEKWDFFSRMNSTFIDSAITLYFKWENNFHSFSLLKSSLCRHESVFIPWIIDDRQLVRHAESLFVQEEWRVVLELEAVSVQVRNTPKTVSFWAAKETDTHSLFDALLQISLKLTVKFSMWCVMKGNLEESLTGTTLVMNVHYFLWVKEKITFLSKDSLGEEDEQWTEHQKGALNGYLHSRVSLSLLDSENILAYSVFRSTLSVNIKSVFRKLFWTRNWNDCQRGGKKRIEKEWGHLPFLSPSSLYQFSLNITMTWTTAFTILSWNESGWDESRSERLRDYREIEGSEKYTTLFQLQSQHQSTKKGDRKSL